MFHTLSSIQMYFFRFQCCSGCGVMTLTGLQRDVIALTEVEAMMKETDNTGYEHTPLLSPISTMSPPSLLAGFPIWLLLLLCSWLLPPSPAPEPPPSWLGSPSGSSCSWLLPPSPAPEPPPTWLGSPSGSSWSSAPGSSHPYLLQSPLPPGWVPHLVPPAPLLLAPPTLTCSRASPLPPGWVPHLAPPAPLLQAPPTLTFSRAPSLLAGFPIWLLLLLCSWLLPPSPAPEPPPSWLGSPSGSSCSSVPGSSHPHLLQSPLPPGWGPHLAPPAPLLMAPPTLTCSRAPSLLAGFPIWLLLLLCSWLLPPSPAPEPPPSWLGSPSGSSCSSAPGSSHPHLLQSPLPPGWVPHLALPAPLLLAPPTLTCSRAPSLLAEFPIWLLLLLCSWLLPPSPAPEPPPSWLSSPSGSSCSSAPGSSHPHLLQSPLPPGWGPHLAPPAPLLMAPPTLTCSRAPSLLAGFPIWLLLLLCSWLLPPSPAPEPPPSWLGSPSGSSCSWLLPPSPAPEPPPSWLGSPSGSSCSSAPGSSHPHLLQSPLPPGWVPHLAPPAPLLLAPPTLTCSRAPSLLAEFPIWLLLLLCSWLLPPSPAPEPPPSWLGSSSGSSCSCLVSPTLTCSRFPSHLAGFPIWLLLLLCSSLVSPTVTCSIAPSLLSWTIYRRLQSLC